MRLLRSLASSKKKHPCSALKFQGYHFVVRRRIKKSRMGNSSYPEKSAAGAGASAAQRERERERPKATHH